MKTVILAGGRGTRLAEETELRPKPMVEIGGRPILLHIMALYAARGHRDFVIACGYKGEMIKDYFRDVRHESNGWRVALEDTGLDTPTAGRILRLRDTLKAERFFLTYGDGVSNVDIAELLSFHVKHGRLATVTAVRPPARFGALELEGDRVREFSEKPHVGEGWINGGFFVFEPGIMEYMREDAMLERAPLERLAEDRQLMAFRHDDFWQCMDTLRDKQLLESLWASGKPPWRA